MADTSWIEEFSGAYPYAGGSGSVNVDTSVRGEWYRDYSGVTASNQRRALQYLAKRKGKGAIYRELLELAGFEGTEANTALTQLHKAHLIIRLAAKRRNCHVYVLHAYQFDREEYPYEPQAVHLSTQEGIDRAEQLAKFLRDRSKFGQKPKSGDKELAYALDYVVSVSKRKMESKRAAKERAREAKNRRDSPQISQ